MSRYREYGKLDDRYASEGDTYFLRMNARLRATQLKPGEVQLSQNGRMNKDGTWQPRKGLQALSGAITLDADAIRLPYAVSAAQRQSNVVTLTLTDTPSTAFVPGENFTVAGLGGFSVDPNGTHALVSVSFTNKQLTFAQTAADDSFTTSATSLSWPASTAITVTPFTLNDDGINEVYGSAVFSDPNSDNSDDYIFTATNSVCDILRLRDGVKFKVRYPGSNTVSDRCELLQAFNKFFIFRGKKTSFQSTPALTSKVITSASRSSTTITVNSTAHGRVANDFVTLVGLGNWTTNPNGVYKVVTASTNSFTVTSTASGSETFIVSGATAQSFNDFDLVTSGGYTLPAYITDLAVEATDGVVTVSETGHGLSQGDELSIIKAEAPVSIFAGETVRVSSTPSVSIFTFNLDVENVSLGQNIALTLSHPQAISYFIHQPATPYAVLNQRRLWMPYFYTSDASPTKRSNQDEIVASQIMDGDTFDVIGNQFKITGGSADYVVALEPFTEDRMIVFCRRSVAQINGVSGSLADARMNVITPDVGCSARRSIVQIANKIFFLSDQGVYGLEFLDNYNLRGLEVPISEPIQPYMERVNQQYADKACGAYFDNRYFLALPIDTAPGTGTATENNTILVYSVLNQGWESIDTVASAAFNVRDMLVSREGTENALYITTSEGGVHKIEGFDGGDQVSVIAGASVPVTLTVASILKTREYDASAIDRKYFARAEIHLKSDLDSTSDATIDFNSTDPDATRTGTTVSGALATDNGGIPTALAADEDASIRTSVRLRGYGCSATVTPSRGRPFVRAVKIDARLTDRSQTSTQ
jgi:hypothetical protein